MGHNRHSGVPRAFTQALVPRVSPFMYLSSELTGDGGTGRCCILHSLVFGPGLPAAFIPYRLVLIELQR
jgi:hypothetical protein